MKGLEEDAKFLKKTIEEETNHKCEIKNTVSNYYVEVKFLQSIQGNEAYKRYYSQGKCLFSLGDGTSPAYTIEEIIKELKKLNPINL